MNEKRKTTVAGMFYEQNANRLEEQLENCFTHDFGPGSIPKEKETELQLLGVIVPHAGLTCSGPFAAHSFFKLAEHGLPETCILIGPNHSGMGPAAAVDPSGEWETPLGPIPIDEDLVQQLVSSNRITADEATLHQQENSLEVQLPFIKYLSKHLKKNCSIVPIVMAQQDLKNSQQIGEHIANIMANESKHITIIASSDFSHEGYSYGRFPPSGLTADQFARKQDHHAIDAINKKNPQALYKAIQEHGISMCGYGPVISLLTIANKYPDSTVELLKYGTSYDTCSDSNTCVGYAAVAVTRQKGK